MRRSCLWIHHQAGLAWCYGQAVTFEPGGEANIPKQTPVPSLGSEGPGARESAAANNQRLLVRTAIINGAVLMAAVVTVYVLKLVEPEIGVWVIVAAALFSGLYMTMTVMRIQRTGGTSTVSAGSTGTPAPAAGAPEAGPTAAGRAHAPAATASGRPAVLRFEVSESFTITGRGTVVAGTVTSGTVASGDAVAILREGQVIARSRVNGVELTRRMADQAGRGDHAGLLLAELDRSDVSSGDLVVADDDVSGGY